MTERLQILNGSALILRDYFMPDTADRYVSAKQLRTFLNGPGYEVIREYYYNDAGNQMKKLAESIKARYIQNTTNPDYPFPEDGYHSDNILDIVNIIKRKIYCNFNKFREYRFFPKNR